ncbi:MerR family transcriptional regulator [Nocardia sp. NPDC020380]|uniref:MerR family transcriptional regulator n=1 Tax=Nocardia sp. NPDC020380 TaxID=3364309 RepID=UPI0037A48FCA
MADLDAEPDDDMSIGEVSRQTGLGVHTLRYYEREGLMLSQNVMRGTGGHRRYSRQDVFWLRMCIKLRASGMPLAQIRRYVELVREGPGNEQPRLELLRAQQTRVEHQLAELQECLRVINRKIGIYEQHVAVGTASDLWTLTN